MWSRHPFAFSWLVYGRRHILPLVVNDFEWLYTGGQSFHAMLWRTALDANSKQSGLWIPN
jgi:hypothetical protein